MDGGSGTQSGGTALADWLRFDTPQVHGGDPAFRRR
jgi:hypothetical protein